MSNQNNHMKSSERTNQKFGNNWTPMSNHVQWDYVSLHFFKPSVFSWVSIRFVEFLHCNFWCLHFYASFYLPCSNSDDTILNFFLGTGLHYSHVPVNDFQWRSLNCELLKAEILGSAQTPQEICLWPGFVRGKPHIFYFHSFAINVFAKILFSDLEMQDHWQRWRQMIVLQRISSAPPELGHKMHF